MMPPAQIWKFYSSQLWAYLGVDYAITKIFHCFIDQLSMSLHWLLWSWMLLLIIDHLISFCDEVFIISFTQESRVVSTKHAELHKPCLNIKTNFTGTVETLYSKIYYSKYFIELIFDKSTQYVALWTHKRHPIPHPFGRAMECLLWVLQQKLTVL